MLSKLLATISGVDMLVNFLMNRVSWLRLGDTERNMDVLRYLGKPLVVVTSEGKYGNINDDEAQILLIKNGLCVLSYSDGAGKHIKFIDIRDIKEMYTTEEGELIKIVKLEEWGEHRKRPSKPMPEREPMDQGGANGHA